VHKIRVTCPVRPVMRPWFGCWFRRYYIVCLFRSYTSPLALFLHFFLTYLYRYVSFPLRTDRLLFQAGCLKRRLNLASVFLCLFCVVVHFFSLLNACFCCVRFSVFHTKARDWLAETSPKWPVLCRVGRKSATQSINTCSVFCLLASSISTVQEAQLSPTDRAMRRVSWYLANCHATCRNYLYDKSWINRSYEVGGLQWAMCNKHVQSTMERSSRFHCPVGVINIPTTDEFWISPVYTVSQKKTRHQTLAHNFPKC